MGEIAFEADLCLEFENGAEVRVGKLKFSTDKSETPPRWFYAKLGLAFIRIGLMVALCGRKYFSVEEAET